MEVIKGAIVCLKKGEKLTDEERKALAEYIEFRHKRAAKLKRIKELKPTDG